MSTAAIGEALARMTSTTSEPQAASRLLPGPARVVSTSPLTMFLKLRVLTGVGRAQPTRKRP